MTSLANTQSMAAQSPIPFKVGEFTKIYDPSVGENEAWWINDHCFFQDKNDCWHLIGITKQQPRNRLLSLILNDSAVKKLSWLGRKLMYLRIALLRRKGDPIKADEEINFAHASSEQLLAPQWQKQKFALSVDTLAHETHLWAPHIVQHENTYYMFYCAGGAAKNQYRMHLATSNDGKHWQRSLANPLFIDGYEARDPMVLKIDDEWIMYYTATSEIDGGNHIVAYRRSKDLLHWSERRVAFTDPVIGTAGGPTESPFVVKRKGKFYLFLSMRHGYRPGYYADTEVFVSDIPYHWEIENKVGRINAHAAEVITINQQWYISHCGWYQGGVYLAPLTWLD